MIHNFKKLFFVLFFLLFSSVSFAQRGCCSHHGGVAGCDSSTGYLMCQDGTDSPSCMCPVLSKATSPSASSWVTYYSPDHKFQINFPLYPTYLELTVPNKSSTFKVETYVAHDKINKIMYIVGKISNVYEVDLENPIESMQKILDEQTKNASTNIAYSQIDKFKGYPSFDTIEITKEGYIRTKSILVGSTMYELKTVSSYQNYSEEKYNQFINSFAVN